MHFVAEVFAIFIDANLRIKGIQIGDHQIKIVHFAGELILELSQKTSQK